MSYVWFFLGVLWYTLGVVVVCGLVVSLCRRLFVGMMGGGVGRGIVMVTSILGTPIHELGHALMCLLFGHKITEMVLWQPRSKDGTLGYVSHSYNPRNPYQVLGNLFIGIGPILSGMGVITLILWLCFPTAFDAYVNAARNAVSAETGIMAMPSVLWSSLRSFPTMVKLAVTDVSVPVWARILGVLGLLSISLHIELSPADIKGSLKAIPLYLLPVLLLTVVCSLMGAEAMGTVTSALAAFSAYLASLFAVVILISLAEVIVALPVWGLRQVFRRR